MKTTTMRSASWCNDKQFLEQEIVENQLAGLNQIVFSRRRQYNRGGLKLSSFYFLGRFMSDECGNFGKINWDAMHSLVPVDPKTFPLVATEEEWWEFLKAHDFEMQSVSLMSELPPAGMRCDLCEQKWQLEDCHTAVVVRKSPDVALDEWVGHSLAEAEQAIQLRFIGEVFIQPDLAVMNKAYKRRKYHPVDRTLSLYKGWVRNPKFSTYIVQPGDVASVNVWHYRHPACQIAELERTGRIHFWELFQAAGYGINSMSVVTDEYATDPTHRMPWFLVTTNHGNFKIGWRRRVIELQWEGESVGPDRHLPSDLFHSEKVTKGPTYIHADDTKKAIEYLRRIRRAA